MTKEILESYAASIQKQSHLPIVRFVDIETKSIDT